MEDTLLTQPSIGANCSWSRYSLSFQTYKTFPSLAVATLRLAFLVARVNAERTFSYTDEPVGEVVQRLARTLLLLARYGNNDQPHAVLHGVSQETLAEMIGTTRSRVNFFRNKFRKLGFINYNGGIQINTSLSSVVLHD